MPSKIAPAFVPLDPPEKSRALLQEQLAKLEELKKRQFSADEVKGAEKQWQHLTNVILERAFEPNSTNQWKFQNALSAGRDNAIRHQPYGRPHYGPSLAQEQHWFSARCDALETLLKSIIQELELSIPHAEIKGVYEPGEEYDFYYDLSSLFQATAQDLLIVDAYLDEQLFNLYVSKVHSGAVVRILSNKIATNVETIARMYARSRRLEMRSSAEVHDRAIFLDQRGWVIGQSIKDAARKKPTYMIELNEPLLTASRDTHSRIWAAAAVVI